MVTWTARVGVVAALAILLGACSTSFLTRPSVATNADLGGKLTPSWTAQREIADCKYLVESGDFNAAIPRLVSVVNSYPTSPSAIEARYWLGVAYHRASVYRDAMSALQEYLKLAPNGPLAAKAHEELSAVQREYLEKFDVPEEFEPRIRQLKAALRKKPKQLDLQWELADLLWRQGDYRAAGRTYLHIVEKHPEAKSDSRLAGRIQETSEGKWVVVGPGEVQRRDTVTHPLEITNTASFKGRRESWSNPAQYYTVTGEAVNQGARALQGARVTVTIYGFGMVVHDTRTVLLGRLNPRESRAFSVSFTNIDNVNNITQYVCEGGFDR